MCLTIVTTRIGVELVVVQEKQPDLVGVGFQQYPTRIFPCTTVPPRVYKGGQRHPPNKKQPQTTPKAIQATTQDIGYYTPRSPDLSKSMCSLHR